MKDATATALYGARGANGVIMVTTKEGKQGKVQLNIRYEKAYSAAARKVSIADPITYMRLHNEALATREPLSGRIYSLEKILISYHSLFLNVLLKRIGNRFSKRIK